ncbi:protein ABIL4 [Sesamum indicum]|uniref:Protein ABIL4 n=1 Tax=Sesamum indicum TaxID=4182 RepID=A0A6I9U867_SESIN|nr:protein ABIL4 [Sesamum indicum]
MEEEAKLLVDSATEFHKSLKELRDFSSQLYHAADYWETAFFSSQHKRLIVENTKEYVSGAVATLVDHVGSISAILDYTVSKTTSVPQTEHKIGTLKQRIETCQQHSHKLGLPRLHWTARFSRFHSRYTSLRLQDSAFMTAVCSVHKDSERDDAKGKEGNACETNKRLTDHCKPALVESSNSNMQRKSGVSPALGAVRDYKHLLPAHEGLPVSPKAEHSAFQFQLQEAQKVKRSMINWKLIKNKEIAMLIRRGKQILA